VLMNKKVVWIVIAIVLAIGSGVGYLLVSDTQTAQQDAASTDEGRPNDGQNQQQDPGLIDAGGTNNAGAYINYKEGLVETTDGTKLLFFHAPWCPQCRDLEADIRDKGVPAGVTIFKVDYDTSQGLRQKYGVTIQTTIVRVDDEGNLVEKFVAYDDPSLDAVVKNVL
jgi:thiol-disulfide isomerase/thioredoxin